MSSSDSTKYSSNVHEANDWAEDGLDPTETSSSYLTSLLYQNYLQPSTCNKTVFKASENVVRCWHSICYVCVLLSLACVRKPYTCICI